MELYDIRAGRTLPILLDGNRASVAFSPDSPLLAAGIDATVIVLDVTNGKRVLPPLDGHQGAVTKIAFSPDGKTLVTGGGENVLRLWNLATGQEVGKVPETYSFTLSADGSTLAIWMSGWLRIFYVPTLAEFDITEGLQGDVHSVGSFIRQLTAARVEQDAQAVRKIWRHLVEVTCQRSQQLRDPWLLPRIIGEVFDQVCVPAALTDWTAPETNAAYGRRVVRMRDGWIVNALRAE